MNDAALRRHLLEREELLIAPEVRSRPELVSPLHAEDFREFGSSGRVYDKAAILSLLAAEEGAEFVVRFSDFELARLGEAIALVTSRCTVEHRGERLRSSLRSSLWIRDGDNWRLRFHQGTLQPG